MKRPTFTTEELKTLWPRLNRGAQATYLEMRKTKPYQAERYLRVQFDYLHGRVPDSAPSFSSQALKLYEHLKQHGPLTRIEILGLGYSSCDLRQLYNRGLITVLSRQPLPGTKTGRANIYGLLGQEIPKRY